MKDPHKVWQTLTKFDYPIILFGYSQYSYYNYAFLSSPLYHSHKLSIFIFNPPG